MTIIKKIIEHKKKEIDALENYLDKDLEVGVISFLEALARPKGASINIIAEIKKASPSQELIGDIIPREKAVVYQKNGVSAISCLTDHEFFQGSTNDLASVSATVALPVIRKDFIFTKNQIAEARFFGASSYLLMVEVMEKMNTNLAELIEYGRNLGMEPLVETYDKNSITTAVAAGAKIIGVNSRNFQKKDLPIEFDRFERLLPLIPKGIIRVAESGFSTKEDIQKVSHLADAVLIGTALMKKNDTEVADFITSLSTV